MRKSRQKWIRLTIWLVGATTLLSYIVLSPLLRSRTKHDQMAAVKREGIATVEQLLPPKIEEGSNPIPAQVWVRFEGQLLPSKEVFGSAELKVGNPAQITYRIGKSGRIYIDRVEPLPPPK